MTTAQGGTPLVKQLGSLSRSGHDMNGSDESDAGLIMALPVDSDDTDPEMREAGEVRLLVDSGAASSVRSVNYVKRVRKSGSSRTGGPRAKMLKKGTDSRSGIPAHSSRTSSCARGRRRCRSHR